MGIIFDEKQRSWCLVMIDPTGTLFLDRRFPLCSMLVFFFFDNMPNVSYLTKPLTQNKVTDALTTEKEKNHDKMAVCAR
jgi:hypothetical protein